MRRDFFCHCGKRFASPSGQYEARFLSVEVAGANHWLHQSDRREAFVVGRVAQAWRETSMCFAVGSWWARLVSTDRWPSGKVTRIAMGDDGMLSVDYDGDPVLAKALIGGSASKWRATLAWNERRWRAARVR